jgi:hypothetical protein
VTDDRHLLHVTAMTTHFATSATGEDPMTYSLTATYTPGGGWHDEHAPYADATPRVLTALHNRKGVTAVAVLAHGHTARFRIQPPADTIPGHLVHLPPGDPDPSDPTDRMRHRLDEHRTAHEHTVTALILNSTPRADHTVTTAHLTLPTPLVLPPSADGEPALLLTEIEVTATRFLGTDPDPDQAAPGEAPFVEVRGYTQALRADGVTPNRAQAPRWRHLPKALAGPLLGIAATS